jgi:hypothetical protein
MKYRILTNEELQHLEEDLKQFLIVNGIHAEEWATMNQETPEKAVQLVEVFSDTVLQKVYEKLNFLEFRSTDSCMLFHLLPEKMELISLQSTDKNCDLSSVESIHDALQNHVSNLNFFKSEKPYTSTRETAIHELIESGCVVSSSEFWNVLKHVLDVK